MNEPDINSPIMYTPAEHEIFLSFQNDSDAEAFYEWWQREGFKMLDRWHQRNKDTEL